MYLKVSYEVTGDDPGFAARYAERLADLAPFHQACGIHMMGRMQERLAATIGTREDNVHTGRLADAMTPSAGEDTMFEVTGAHIECGPTLPYAAQVNEGGPIDPVRGRYLAIPLTMELKRSGKWPREWGPGALVRIGMCLFEAPVRKTKAGRILKKPRYLLVEHVEQTGKFYAQIDESDMQKFAELLDHHLTSLTQVPV